MSASEKGLLTATGAAQHGISMEALRAGITHGALVRIRRGLYVLPHVFSEASPEQQISMALRAVSVINPHAVVVAPTACVIHELPDPRPIATVALNGIEWPVVHVALPNRAHAIEWVVEHEDPHVHWETKDFEGQSVRITPLFLTATDAARALSLGHATAILDAAARRELTQRFPAQTIRDTARSPMAVSSVRADFKALALEARFRTGVPRLRRAIALMDPASESVLESISRSALRRFRLPIPECGVPVTGSDGRIYWADMKWQHVLGEADGLSKYESVEVLRKEKHRQEALEQAGFRVVRWTWEEITRKPEQVAARIHSALANPGVAASYWGKAAP